MKKLMLLLRRFLIILTSPPTPLLSKRGVGFAVHGFSPLSDRRGVGGEVTKDTFKIIFRNSVIIVLIGLLIHCSYTPSSGVKALDEELKKIITEKAQRAGYYSLASKQAEKEGYGELALYFSEIAQEEITHIKALSVLTMKTQRTTKKNVLKAMKMEKNMARREYQSILNSAKQQEDEEIIKIFEQIIQDEERHFLGLRGFIKKKKVK